MSAGLNYAAVLWARHHLLCLSQPDRYDAEDSLASGHDWPAHVPALPRNVSLDDARQAVADLYGYGEYDDTI